MHIEKSYQQLTLVDDAGKRHDLCSLLANLCPEVSRVKANVPGVRSKGSQEGDQEAGAKDSQEADSQGPAGGGQSAGQGTIAASTPGQDQKPAKANKGTRRKKKSKKNNGAGDAGES